jgi:hypothetical protein
MPDQQINVNIDPDKIEAKYSDQAFINSNPFGFVFDFAQALPQMNMIKIVTRVAMSPEHTKAFAIALTNVLQQYEKQNGEIKLTQEMKEETGKGQIGFNINKEK